MRNVREANGPDPRSDLDHWEGSEQYRKRASETLHRNVASGKMYMLKSVPWRDGRDLAYRTQSRVESGSFVRKRCTS